MNMPPQVAHYPPPSAHQYSDPGLVLPPFEAATTLRRPERPAPLPLRSFRDSASSSGLAPPHRAYPAEGHGGPPPILTRAHSSGHSYGRDYGDPSEHMLRRKTPNGTLAAGYDGTPIQWTGKAPPLKHVVLPLSTDISTQQDGHFGRHNDTQDFRSRSTNVGWSHNSEPNLASFNVSTDMRMNSDPGNWAQYPHLSDSNSSSHTWNDVQLSHITPKFADNGMQIPTVYQPSYQMVQRPTISNDGGLYGPYWPDGKFVPYRPAAHRGQDTHYLEQNHYAQEFQQNYHAPPSELLSAFPQTVFRNQVDSAPRDGHLPFLTDNRDYNTEEKYSMLPVASSHRRSTNLYSSAGDGSKTPTASLPERGSGNPHFKEKTLSWAHTIYVDLLAFLHQSRRDSKHSRPYRGARTSSKTNIYPKPPRQPTSHLGNSHYGATHNANAQRPQVGRSHSMSSNSYDEWEHNPSFEPRYHRTTSSDAPHYVSTFQSSTQESVNPISRAQEALEMLTNLCEQSGWIWIDGMLLGGCLAYGLDEYHKALDWYSKIIALEPKHVEAMSNLAATLLCLNRREEAEQHWLQSVRLRPNYFEAVEHLVGLLCNEQRGKEAVGIIDFVERSLRKPKQEDQNDYFSETSSNADRESISSIGAGSEAMTLDYEVEGDSRFRSPSFKEGDEGSQAGFGSSGFLIPGCDNGRMLALVHAKGNMLYALGDINRASRAFEDAVLISAGKGFYGIHGLIRKIVSALSLDGLAPLRADVRSPSQTVTSALLLLPPEKALQTARMVFAKRGDLPGLHYVPEGVPKRAAISTTSNSLLSLAKIFQDAMSNNSSVQRISRMPGGVGDILALYYLSLSLQPSPSTANNVGILLAGVQQPASHRPLVSRDALLQQNIPGVVPGSGIALALAYYNYGLNLDNKHAHIYTNLGSLLKDIGQLTAAISMYEKAVQCDSSFDIALANLANAVKDQGRTSDAIEYYRRAVKASPDFAEAVCGLANALNSVCDWRGRGGVILDGGRQDRYHVDDFGMILDASSNGNGGGWMKRVVDIVSKQLTDGATWGRGTLQDQALHQVLHQIEAAETDGQWQVERRSHMQSVLSSWMGHRWEGARLLRLIERVTKRVMHRWYLDRYVNRRELPPTRYRRPQVPAGLSVPSAPTVLPFHTFTCPLPAKDIRMISQRNALRISCSTLRTPWVHSTVFTPPSPPAPHLNIGYVSSDFNNHPLAHLMQSVFGFHNPSRAKAFCYATTASDNSIHRQQIEREAPVFYDASSWSAERLVQQILRDQIHILVNLNGYTRGARNEVFAARAAPIQMSFMGFAGTLGAEWCDYLLADETAIPPNTLRPWRRNIDLDDQLRSIRCEEDEDWIYSENIIFCRDTFFCCDHAQSEPRETRVSWEDEQSRRWQMRKELFPSLSDDAIILGNFNQLYKIEPTTFRSWLRILDKVPRAILWLLRFPDLGENNLKRTAREWAGEGVASRIWFTDVAPKHQHISRARVCDLFLDTPECNAHTTAADILWSSTPLLTLPRYEYKMCSRMAASILKGALPRGERGRQAAADLIAVDDQQYEEFAIKLASNLSYTLHPSGFGEGVGRLADLRKLLYESRYTCALFDTRRWVRDLEEAYEEAWRRWVADEGGDIYL